MHEEPIWFRRPSRLLRLLATLRSSLRYEARASQETVLILRDPGYLSSYHMTLNSHEHYMRLAVQEAQVALEKGEVPTGCVIVQQPTPPGCPGHPSEGGDLPKKNSSASVIGRAHNQVELLKDPTAHAEMIAITQAADALGDWRLSNTILYVTKEPCAMCAGAIVLARIPTVVFGTSDPQRGGAASVFNILNNPRLNHRCEVISGILEDECRTLLQDFFRGCRS